MSLLGIDVGTTGAKAIVFGLDGAVLGQGYREYPHIFPQPGWVEMDSDEVWSATKEAIAEAVSRAGRRDQVKALAVSSQGEGITPIGADGAALANTIVSFDSRTTAQSQWWERQFGKRKLFEITGLPLSPMYSINKIMWWRDNQPEVFARAWKFLCYEDFTAFRLGAEPTIDYSLAGRTMAFDVRSQRWCDEILAAAGVEPARLAAVAPSGAVIGKVRDELASQLGLPRGVAIATGGHDQPCGALGSGVIEPRVAVDATGTTECITPVFLDLKLSDSMLESNYCCYHHVVPGTYITLAFNFTGGSLLRWYRDTLGKQEREDAEAAGMEVYEMMIGLATAGPSPVMVLPHFALPATPWNDPQSKGVMLGLTLATTKGDIIKALLDGVTFEMRLNLEHLERAGVTVETLRAIGGGAKSPTWLQLKADVFKRPVLSLSVSEAACLGAALLAGTAIGEYSSLAEAVSATVRVTNTYEPNPQTAARYDERYEIYRQLYPTLRDLLHAL
jgi:xylulokinase